jgi:hypothetical protein
MSRWKATASTAARRIILQLAARFKGKRLVNRLRGKERPDLLA